MESIPVGAKAMVAISMAELPGSAGQIVLAMGGLDNKIHLYCGDRTGKVFYKPLNIFILEFVHVHLWLQVFLLLCISSSCMLVR